MYPDKKRRQEIYSHRLFVRKGPKWNVWKFLEKLEPFVRAGPFFVKWVNFPRKNCFPGNCVQKKTFGLKKILELLRLIVPWAKKFSTLIGMSSTGLSKPHSRCLGEHLLELLWKKIINLCGHWVSSRVVKTAFNKSGGTFWVYIVFFESFAVDAARIAELLEEKFEWMIFFPYYITTKKKVLKNNFGVSRHFQLVRFVVLNYVSWKFPARLLIAEYRCSHSILINKICTALSEWFWRFFFEGLLVN